MQSVAHVKMQPVAHVRCVPDDEMLKIAFNHDGKLMEFNRKKTDPVEKTLQRISLKLIPKKKKKKKSTTDESPCKHDISLLDGDFLIDGTTSNEAGFIEGRILKISESLYTVEINSPTAISVSLPESIMVSFPVFCDVKLEFANLQDTSFEWYTKCDEELEGEWKHVAQGFTYVPTIHDIGLYLKCIVKAGNGMKVSSLTSEVISCQCVAPGPGVCLFDERQLYTQSFLAEKNQFRIVCYNILADVFADTDYAKQVLFPYVPDYAIKAHYRRQLVFKELLGYHADVICLQECQMSIYKHYLKPLLHMNGYGGSIFLKLGEMPEGEAIFYRQEKFAFVKDLSISVRDAMQKPCNSALLSHLQSSPGVLEGVRKKTAVAQILILQETSPSKRYLCVLNTHLYYKRFAVRARFLQMVFLMNYVYNELKDEDISLIVSGDLNSLKGSPVLDYLSGVEILNDHAVWFTNDEGLTEENAVSKNLKCPLKLMNLSGHPNFTTYVPHCKTTLDYVFGCERLSISNFVPLPQPEDIDPYVGLPCVVHPSDHLALVLDIHWS